MAIAVKTADLPEIIEVITDDGGAFGDHHGTGTTADNRGGRWVGPAAVAALVGLIAYFVATSSPTSPAPKAATATSTTVTTSATTPTKPTSDAVPTLGYYAADPPPGFSVHYANLQQLDHAPFTGYGYQLWATPDSSATLGKWFSVFTYRGASTRTAADAYRAQAGPLSIAISHTAAGQAVTQFTEDGRIGVTIASFGWSDEDLIRLATSVQADERSIGFTDVWFDSDHDLIGTVQPWLAVQSVPAEQVAYVSSSDPGNSVIITVGPLLQPYEGGTTEARQVALRFLLDRNTPFTVDGHPAIAGAVVSPPGSALATWVVGDHVITVSAAMPVAQLITVARTVHEVSSDEWDGMKLQAINNQRSNPRYEQSSSQQISTGTDPDARPWSISVATATSGTEQQINWSWGSNGLRTTPDGTAQIHTVVDNDRTYVLADLPRSIAPAGVLLITGDGLDVAVPFVDVDERSDRTFAAYAFTEPGQFSFRVVGSDGDVRAIWPTS